MRRARWSNGNACFRKGHWTHEEDELLRAHLKRHGVRNWSEIPKASGLHRSGKSCRLRWVNYLKPDLKRGKFSEDEEDLIVKLHSLLGNRWSLIAGRIPGRTDNEIKNYWNSHLSKKISSMSNKLKCARAQGMSFNSNEDLPSQELAWLEHEDILVVKESPSISCSSSQQQLDCSNSEFYDHNSDFSPSDSNSQPASASRVTLDCIQYDKLVLSTMQQLQADISIEQEQEKQLDWDSLEDLTLESNGLLEVLEWL